MFSEILVAYDGSDSAQDSLGEAIEVASTFHAMVHLVAVVHLSDAEMMAEAAFPMGLRPYDEKTMQSSLANLAARFGSRGCEVKTHVVVDNNPATAIRDLAIDLGIDLIILGHRRQGPLSRLWNGSVGLSLLANAPCSIFVATEPRVKSVQRPARGESPLEPPRRMN